MGVNIEEDGMKLNVLYICINSSVLLFLLTQRKMLQILRDASRKG